MLRIFKWRYCTAVRPYLKKKVPYLGWIGKIMPKHMQMNL